MNADIVPSPKPVLLLAFLRAVEAARSDRDRLFDDRFSAGMLTGLWKVCLHPALRGAIIAYTEAFAPGLMGSLYCRTRYIDDALRAALRRGVDQVVILGAGLDSRAYRIFGIQRAHVFELDHPALQRVKQQRVTKLFGAVPGHVTFAPIDFERQSLISVLADAGFCRDRASCFIWEGVTQHLPPDTVDSMLSDLAAVTTPGSELLFTYIDRDLLPRLRRGRVDPRIQAALRQRGMSWQSGFNPSRLADYLLPRGFQLVEQVSAPDFAARYLRPYNRHLQIFMGEHVVVARRLDTAWSASLTAQAA